MRNTEARELHETDGGREFTVPGGCVACGGDIIVRFAVGTARSVCKGCGWISRPHLVPGEDGMQLAHPPGAFA